MPTAYTLTGDIGDLLGNTTVVPTAEAWIETNVRAEDALVHAAVGGTVRLGGLEVPLNPDGTFTIAGLVGSDSTDLNVAAGVLQYRLVVKYRNPATGREQTWRDDWFHLNGDSDIATVVKAISPEVAETGADIIAQAEAARDQASEIAGLTGEDSAVAFLVDNPSDTQTALDGRYATDAEVTTTADARIAAKREIPSGVAGLDATGKLYQARIPDVSDIYATHAAVESTADTRARRFHLDGETLATTQTWLDTITPGDVAQLVGSLTVDSALTVPAGVTLDLSAATIVQTVATGSTLILSDGSAIRGGAIECPASWTTTTTGDFFDAVVYVPPGVDGCDIAGLSIENVYRLGIGVKGDHTRIRDCRIEGNLPAGYYTGTETSHYAIKIDPSGTTVDGATVVADNIIGGCVQGVMVGNFGSGVGRGVVVSGNLFHDCWNHGIYQSHGSGMTFASNTFQRCQKPIVASGTGNTVTGNACYTNQTGDERDITAIALRNAFACVVTGNTIVGEGATTSVAITLDNTLGATAMGRNIVADNTINLTGSVSAPAIRVGNPSTTTECNENRVSGNVITAPGQSGSDALIEVTIASGSTGYGNVVEGNTVVIGGPSHGIQLTRQRFGVIANNYVRLAYNAAASTTLIMARLTASSSCRVTGNTWATTSGANVTVHGVREMDTTCNSNQLGPNVARWSSGALAGSTAVVQADAGNSSIVGVTVGEQAAATTLGAVTGKVGIYDDKGTLLGYAPLYGSIT